MNIKSALLTLATALALSSCNRISGIGKDVEAMGSKIDSASQATNELARSGSILHGTRQTFTATRKSGHAGGSTFFTGKPLHPGG